MSSVHQAELIQGRSRAQDAPAFSIIIPAKNEQAMIGQCLESLTRMTCPLEQFEVILVDNGSDDRTIEIARSYSDRLNLLILENTVGRISRLRNIGAAQARGEVLAFLDADCAVDADWAEHIQRSFRRSDTGILGAHYRIPPASSWVARVWDRYHQASKEGDVSHVPAGNLLIRRDDFVAVRGFDESIQTNEDYEICCRAREAGMPVRAHAELSVIHFGTPQTLRAFFRQQVWHGSHVLKVWLRDFAADSNRDVVFFALYTLCCAVAFAASLLISGIFGQWWLPAVFLVALLLPPVLLAARDVFSNHRWSDLLPLICLYLVYGTARARALLSISHLK